MITLRQIPDKTNYRDEKRDKTHVMCVEHYLREIDNLKSVKLD